MTSTSVSVYATPSLSIFLSLYLSIYLSLSTALSTFSFKHTHALVRL